MTGRIDLGATYTDGNLVINRLDVGLGNTFVYGTFNIDPIAGSIILPCVLQAYVASTTNLPATYNNGVNGVGATLTLTATGLTFIDGATFVGMVVLLKDQTATTQNGLYVVTNTGSVGVSMVLQRSTSMNLQSQFIGTEIEVYTGGVNSGKSYTCNSSVVPIGTSAITYAATPKTIDDSIALNFGSTTRQMLNLYGVSYGIGVQALTTYFRTDPSGGFAWFLGGTHSNTQYAPGAGGSLVATLDVTGLIIPNRVAINNPTLNAITAVKSYVNGLSLSGMAAANTNSDASVTAVGQAAYVAWNRSGGTGEIDFICHKGGGLGGFYFYITDGTTWTLTASIDSKSNITAASYGSVAVNHGTVTTAVTLDFTAGMFHVFKLTGTSNCSVTFTNPLIPGTYYIRIDGQASSAPVVTWLSAASIKGTALSGSVSSTKSSFYQLFWDGTSWWNTGASLQNL